MYRRSLVGRLSFEDQSEDESQIEEAARKDSAVHVSLSADSPVKQPGTNVIPPSGGTGGSSKPKVVEAGGPPITIGSLVTEYR